MWEWAKVRRFDAHIEVFDCQIAWPGRGQEDENAFLHNKGWSARFDKWRLRSDKGLRSANKIRTFLGANRHADC